MRAESGEYFFPPLAKPNVMFDYILRTLNYKQWLIFLSFLSLKAIKDQWDGESTDF